MPFPALTALGFTGQEDSKYFDDTQIDPAIKFDTQGGLVQTRRRFTRAPGLMITTGFTWLPDAQKQILDSFYQSMSGGVLTFTYIHPTTQVSYTMRFDEPYKTKYTGMGPTLLWDITEIKLRTD